MDSYNLYENYNVLYLVLMLAFQVLIVWVSMEIFSLQVWSNLNGREGYIDYLSLPPNGKGRFINHILLQRWAY